MFFNGKNISSDKAMFEFNPEKKIIEKYFGNNFFSLGKFYSNEIQMN